ncbi:hypothetical protein SCA6_002451 [Theobroma cacao]
MLTCQYLIRSKDASFLNMTAGANEDVRAFTSCFLLKILTFVLNVDLLWCLIMHVFFSRLVIVLMRRKKDRFYQFRFSCIGNTFWSIHSYRWTHLQKIIQLFVTE